MKFFVQYNIIEEVPQINYVYIDGVQTCVVAVNNETLKSDSDASENSDSELIFFYDLPFDDFPNIDNITTPTNNVSST